MFARTAMLPRTVAGQGRALAQRLALRGASRSRPDAAPAVSSATSASSGVELPGLNPPPSVRPNEEVYSFLTPSFRRTTVDDLKDKWDSLGFQIRPLNGYVAYTHTNGSWDTGKFVPAPYMLLHINSGALHYGVSCFEGLKAFACKDGMVRMMNPALNAGRMQKGAIKLRMPQVPTEMFVQGVKEAIERNVDFVPPYGHGASLYIRPLLFASGPMLGLAPLAEEYTFFVTVMPAGTYFSKAGDKTTVVETGIDAMVMEEHDRAAPRGTGAVKAAGNYAADLEPVHSAKAQGFGTTLYLDAKEHRYVEEFSVCNFVGITRDGRYVTPKSEAILASTTNRMLQQLAEDEGLKVEQRPVDFDKEIEDFVEIGMVGTAAVVVRVKSITRRDRVYKTESFDTLSRLREKFTAIQCGDHPDVHNWMVDVCPVSTSQ